MLTANNLKKEKKGDEPHYRGLMYPIVGSCNPDKDLVGQGLVDRTPTNGYKGRAYALSTMSLPR